MGTCSSANNKSKSSSSSKVSEKSNLTANEKNQNNDAETKKSEEKPTVAKSKREETKPKAAVFKKISEMSLTTDIHIKYEFDKHLGSGAFGLVREAFLKENSQERFAIKTVWKSEIPDEEYLRKEIEILLSLDNSYVVKCYEVYEDITCVNFVFELIKGGELFDFIINSSGGHLDDKTALGIFMQMVDAVHYMHCEGFMHRDIKPENFLIHKVNDKLSIKLIDFGFATNFKPGEKFVDKVGSLNYIPPEMLYDDGTYDQKCDNWALGICLYNMLAGKQPFADDDIEILMDKIKNDPVHFNNPVFSTVNNNIKKLIECLLTKDPDKRLSTGEIIMTPWIGKYIGSDDVDTFVNEFDPKKNNEKINRLLNMKKYLKPLFWEFCLPELPYDIQKSIHNDYISKNKDLFAHQLSTYEEFINDIIKKLEAQNNTDKTEKFKKFFEENIDDCHNQKINVFDFIDRLLKTNELIRKEKIRNLFKTIDVSNTDLISLESIQRYFEENKLKYNEVSLRKKVQDIEAINFLEFYIYCDEIEINL